MANVTENQISLLRGNSVAKIEMALRMMRGIDELKIRVCGNKNVDNHELAVRLSMM
jgi:hypothetical protein